MNSDKNRKFCEQIREEILSLNEVGLVFLINTINSSCGLSENFTYEITKSFEEIDLTKASDDTKKEIEKLRAENDIKLREIDEKAKAPNLDIQTIDKEIYNTQKDAFSKLYKKVFSFLEIQKALAEQKTLNLDKFTGYINANVSQFNQTIKDIKVDYPNLKINTSGAKDIIITKWEQFKDLTKQTLNNIQTKFANLSIMDGKIPSQTDKLLNKLNELGLNYDELIVIEDMLLEIDEIYTYNLTNNELNSIISELQQDVAKHLEEKTKKIQEDQDEREAERERKKQQREAERIAKAAKDEEERIAKAAKDEEERIAKAAKDEEERIAKAAKAKADAQAKKDAQAQAAAIAKMSKHFKVPEKIAEMLFYTCIIHNVMNNLPKLLNKVFLNHIKDRETFYKSKIVLKNLTKKLIKYNNNNDVTKIKIEYQQIKNDFEIFKGPVRVYLKLKPYVSKTDNQKKVLFKKQTKFDISTSSDICYDKIDDLDKDIKLMVSSNKTHNFSRIYYNEETSKDIFDDSIKDTINNIIPLNASTIIMAYGPSGSGKTFNLIGDNFHSATPAYGIIYKVLDYLNSEYNDNIPTDNIEKIKTIELDSWQYYMYCGNNSKKTLGKDSYDCKIFNSLLAYNQDVKNLIINPNISIKDFVSEVNDYINGKRDYIYKYERSDKITSSVSNLENGIEQFPETKFNPSGEIRPLEKLLTDGLTPSFVKNYLQRYYDIDDSVLKSAQIEEKDINVWRNQQKSDRDKIQFNISNSMLYNAPTKTVLSLSEGTQIYKDVYLRIPKKFKIEPRELTKEGKIYVKVESKLILLFAKRFYEYGRLTVTNYDGLFKIIEKNRQNQGNHKPLTLNLTGKNNDTIRKIFTKFYLALVRARPTRATVNNPDSSRTHLVVNIKIHKENGKKSNLRFVDLAGNEKADENYFVMREEGNGITGSLLAIKELLKAKQSSKNYQTTISPQIINKFFTSCKTSIQRETCKELYKKCLKKFETETKKQCKLLDLDDENTTVSMYLNLPTYLKQGENVNQCAATADSLYFIEELQKQTKISGEIDTLSTGICKTLFDKWELEKTSKFGKKKRRRSRKGSAKRRKGYQFVKFKKSTKSGKKYDAVFKNTKTGRMKIVSFGSKGMSDYTKHKDDERKYLYLKRHRKRENWNNLMTAGALSRWVLWNKKSLKASMSDYIRRWNK